MNALKKSMKMWLLISVALAGSLFLFGMVSASLAASPATEDNSEVENQERIYNRLLAGGATPEQARCATVEVLSPETNGMSVSEAWQYSYSMCNLQTR